MYKNCSTGGQATRKAIPVGTKDQRSAEKREKTERLVRALKERSKAFGESDELYIRFVRQSARFHRYSVSNQYLIFMQRPDATAVNSYKRWAEVGRQVRKGEKGIYIIAPRPYKRDNSRGEEQEYVSFVHVPVFCYEQTDPIEGFEHPWEPYVFPALTEDTGGEWVDALIRSLQDNGHIVEQFDGGRRYRGRFGVPDHDDAESCVIELDRTQPMLQQLNTLVHELAHMEHWRLEPRLLKLWSQEMVEFIAESASFAVLSELGFDASHKSVAYLATWKEENDEDREKVAMKLVVDIVGSIMTRLEGLEIVPGIVEIGDAA